jgi:hypothetical protein
MGNKPSAPPPPSNCGTVGTYDAACVCPPPSRKTSQPGSQYKNIYKCVTPPPPTNCGPRVSDPLCACPSNQTKTRYIENNNFYYTCK